MFLRDRSGASPVLVKGSLTDAIGVAAVVVESAYALVGGSLVPLGPFERAPSDPPPSAFVPLWGGVSVTATGSVLPPRGATAQEVTLAIERRLTRLLVTGERRWRSTATGDLQATSPARLDPTALTIERAFGGTCAVPPGLLQGLPHPGFEVGYPRNPRGTGFYPDAATAKDQLLPSVELLEQRLTRWNDRPEPAVLEPCPDLAALRAPDPSAPFDAFEVALRMAHHATGRHVFDALPPGAHVALEGLEAHGFSFRVPPSPISVEVVRGKGRDAILFSLRSVHLDAGRDRLLLVHGHSFTYARADAPSSIAVGDSARAGTNPSLFTAAPRSPR